MRSCLSVTPDPRTYASASSTRCLYSGRRAAVLSREGFVVLSCGLYALILSISPESATTIVPVAFNRSRVDAADIVDRGAGRNNARRSLTSEDRQTSQQQQNRLCGDISTEYRRRATGNGGAIAAAEFPAAEKMCSEDRQQKRNGRSPGGTKSSLFSPHLSPASANEPAGRPRSQIRRCSGELVAGGGV